MTSATLNVAARLRSATAFAVLAACVAVGAAGSAHAATAADAPPSLKVRYSDLNLATQAGSQELFSRIEHAAHAVCAPADIRDLQAVAAASACRAQAIEKAVRDVNSPQLAAVYAAHQRKA